MLSSQVRPENRAINGSITFNECVIVFKHVSGDPPQNIQMIVRTSISTLIRINGPSKTIHGRYSSLPLLSS